MIQRNWKYLLVGTVLAVALSSAAPQADAQWWGCYRPVALGCCYTPCYTTCYSPCYAATSCNPCGYDCGGWYLGWRPGPVRRLLLGRYRWYRGGCYGGICTTYDVCCGDVPTACGTATPAQAPTPAKKPVIESPAMPTEPAPSPADQAPAMPEMPKTSAASSENSGVLTVWVPFNATVTINGLETRSTGSRRLYVSHGLKPGFTYKYVIRAELVRDGQTLVDTQTVEMTPGKITAVAFGFNTSPAGQVAQAL